MYELNMDLTAEGLDPDITLPFLLCWYGWLSKKQGKIAKRRRLITINDSTVGEQFGGFAKLTTRGNYQLKNRLPTILDPDMGYVYATYLRAYGKFSSEQYYLYEGSALGLRSDGFGFHDH